MRDEIVAGLKNAVARGQTLEQAAQSFINAGYNPQEVKAAYQVLSTGASNVITNAANPSGQGVNVVQTPQAGYNKPQQLVQQPMQQAQPAPQMTPNAPSNNLPEKKKSSNTTMLIMMIILAALILLGSLGYLFYVLYMK